MKESKQVFSLHHLKVRSEPVISLQRCSSCSRRISFAGLLTGYEPRRNRSKTRLHVRKLGVKRQVHVVAHVSAQVIQDSGAKLLKFSEQSAFAGQVLCIASDHLSPQHVKS